MLLRIAYHYVGEEDAKDLIQDTFIKYMEYQGSFENEEHEKAWLIRAITNLCKNNLKHWYNSKKVDYPKEVETYHSEAYFILDYVRALPINQASIIYLHYYEGYSTKEIAEILQMKENTVLSHLKRGRERLNKQLKGVFDDD